MKRFTIKIDNYEDRRTMASILMSEGYRVSQKIVKKGAMSYNFYVMLEDTEGNVEVEEGDTNVQEV